VVNNTFWESLSDDEKAVVNYAAKSAIVAGRGMGRVIEASDRGLIELGKTMKVNALTPEEKATFQQVAIPEVKKLIVEKFGPEGEAMLNAFLEALAATQ
jgi:TRAP-type C4-dicarboxylate transport system substrate-binding protein